MKCTIKCVNELTAEDINIWHSIIDQNTKLKHAFLTPEFAQACFDANFNIKVSFLTAETGEIAIFPYQFSSQFHELIRYAYRVGDIMNDYMAIITQHNDVFPITKVVEVLRLNGIDFSHLLLENAFNYSHNIGGKNITGHKIDLQDGEQSYFDQLLKTKKKFYKDTERQIKRIENENEPLHFNIRITDNEDEIIDFIIDKKREQYKRTKGENAFQNPSNEKLLHKLVTHSSDYCRPVISSLHSGNDWIAYHYGLQCKDDLHLWFPVYNENYKRYSPGRILLWKMIQNAHQMKISSLDYGQGDSREKQLFSNCPYELTELFWTANGIGGLVAKIIRSVQWRLP